MDATNESTEVPAGSGHGKTFAVALGLLAVALCVLTPIFYGSSTFAAGAGLAQRYELGPLPAGFFLEEQGFRLPGGEQVFVFNDGLEAAISAAGLVAEEEPEPQPEAPPAEPPEEDGAEGKSTPAPVDWSAIEPLSEGTAPTRLFLVRYPAARAESVIAEHFRGIEWKELRFIGTEGGSTAVDGGKLEWSGFGADYVRVRTFIPGGSFRDVLRVNLSLDGECWVAYAVWPELHAGSKEPVGELLASLRPVSS